jgi:hypothetical protein
MVQRSNVSPTRGTAFMEYLAAHSPLMFAALMIGHHFSISAL